MENLSLRNYLEINGYFPNQGVRFCCAPSMKNRTISLKSLIKSPRVIHISDLHFTDSWLTWEWTDLGPRKENQDSVKKIENILKFLLDDRNKSQLNSSTVIITGDITDGGGNGDYDIAIDFIQKLKNDGYDVYVVPGNHDYCWEGNIFFEYVFAAAKAITVLEIIGEIFVPGINETIITAAIDAKIRRDLTFFCPGIQFPDDYIKYLLALFVLVGPLIVATVDTVNNEERRQRFIDKITNYNDYPHVIPIENGYLILLDSMQAQLDEDTGFYCAQGKLGKNQLDFLNYKLIELQEERKKGKKVIICLHHSPFKSIENIIKYSEPLLEFNELGGLDDRVEFLNIISNRIDCLLYGHTTPKGEDQKPTVEDVENKYYAKAEEYYGIPLINCENLGSMSKSYSISVIDLGTYKRMVFQTSSNYIEPMCSWGTFSI